MSLGSTVFPDTIFTIETEAELHAALEQSAGGEVLSLAAGDYAVLPQLSPASLGFAEPLVLIAEDIATPPVVAGLALVEGRALVFDGLGWSAVQDGETLDLQVDTSGVLVPLDPAPLMADTAEPLVLEAALGGEVTVSGFTELSAALELAEDGTTIRLLDGDYRGLNLTDYHRDIRLIADPGTQAIFDEMKLDDVSGLELDGLTFKLTYEEGMLPSVRNFTIDNAADLTIRNALFEGDTVFGRGTVDDGNGAGWALRLRYSEDVTIENSEFRGFFKGLQINLSDDVTIKGNDLHHMRSDAMNIGQVHNMLIEDNHFHDRQLAVGSKDHADLIQMMSRNADVPSSNVIVRGNLFDIGDGDKSQSLFLSNRAVANGAGEEMFYSNFLIEDNVIINGQINALYVGAIDGLVVRNNTVLHADPVNGGETSLPMIRVAQDSTNVVIEQNVTGGIRGHQDQDDWQVAGNVIVQNTDPTAPDHYSDHFVAPTGQLGGHIEKLLVRPDSPIMEQGAGADMMRGGPSSLEKLTPLILTDPQENRAQYLFDASLSTAEEETLDGGAIEYTWAFSDGYQANGMQIVRQFTEPGIYTAILTMKAPDGSTATTDSIVEIAGGDLIGLDPETGALMIWAYGRNEVLYDPGGSASPSDAASPDPLAMYQTAPFSALLVADSPAQPAIDLLAGQTPLILPRESFAPIFETGQFEITMTLAGGGDGSKGGKVLELRGALLVEIDAAGEIIFSLTSEDGKQTQIHSTGARLNDAGVSREVALIYDADSKTLSLSIDGLMHDSAALSGPMALAEGRDMSLGVSHDGQMSDFQLRADPDSYEFGPIIGDDSFPIDADISVDPQHMVLAGDDGDILRADVSGALLIGGAGNDRLREAAGNDVMIGDEGADCFVFDLRRSTGPEHDMIMDLDFGSGDQLRILTRHDGLFSDENDPDNALRITPSGSSVNINSLEDLREVVMSGALRAVDTDQGMLLSLSALPDQVLQLASLETADLIL